MERFIDWLMTCLVNGAELISEKCEKMMEK
jgi:hypothetical protein